MARAGSALSGALSALRGQRAAIVVWTAGVEHKQVIVSDANYEDMRAEARAALRDAGRSTEPALFDIAPVPGPRSRGRRVVMLASAPAADVYARLRPVIAARIIVDRLLTPSAALLSLSRGRDRTSDQAGLESYIALEETAGCIALIREGVLVGAHDLPWGFIEQRGDARSPRSREDVATRLAEDLLVFLEESRIERQDLRHVSICGAAPDLRSMAISLMERLDVEVEPLDSLFGIDERHLPGDSAEFRERVSALRLAWAAAADPHPPLDLYRLHRRRGRSGRVSHVVVAAGTAAGLLLGFEIETLLPPVKPPVTSTSAAGVTDAADTRTMAPRDTPAADGSRTMPAPVQTSGSSDGSRPRPVFRSTREPVPVPNASPTPSVETSVPVTGAPTDPHRQTGVAPADDEHETPLPFEAALDSILYGPDRRVAMVDGRIVEAGDVVRGATVVEITTTAVMLRDSRGRLRRLTAAESQR
jgi:hypothetical protein